MVHIHSAAAAVTAWAITLFLYPLTRLALLTKRSFFGRLIVLFLLAKNMNEICTGSQAKQNCACADACGGTVTNRIETKSETSRRLHWCAGLHG